MPNHTKGEIMNKIILLFSLFLMASIPNAQADTDEGLYAPRAPEGSAFVRFINITDAAVDVSANNKSFGEVGASNNSAYFVVLQGEASLIASDKEVSHSIIEGGFYSALIGDELIIIEDQANTNPAKATLAIINADQSASVSLKAKDNTIDIFKDVETGAMSAREINAVKIDLTVNVAESAEPVVLDPIVLERGNHYTVLFDGKAARIIMAETDTTR